MIIKFLFFSGEIRQAGSYAIQEFTRLFGNEMPPEEIARTINQSFENAGLKNIESLEVIIKALAKVQRIGTQK